MRRSYELWQKVRKQRGSLHPDTKTMYQAYVHQTACLRVYSANVKSKLTLLAAKVAAQPRGERVLLYCSYVEPLRTMQTLLETHGRTCFLYHGDLTESARRHVLQRVQDTPDCCLLMSLKAGGTGLNLGMFHLMAPIDTTPSREEEDQAIARMTRRTSTAPVRVMYVMAVGMYDTAVRYQVWPGKERAVWRLQQGHRGSQEDYGTVYAALKQFEPTLSQWAAFCRKRPASDADFHTTLKRCKY
jgi:superfamily II DNA or RNA helicase